MTAQSVSVPGTWGTLRAQLPPHPRIAVGPAMAQDGHHMEEEVVALRKARRDIDAKLDAALEHRTAWRKDEEERKARTVKRESEEREMDLRGESIATGSPSSDSRTICRRGRHPVLPNRPKEVHWSTKGRVTRGSVTRVREKARIMGK